MTTPDTSNTYQCVTIPAQPGVPSTLPSLERKALYGWDAGAVSDTALASPVDLRFSIDNGLIGGVIGLVPDSAADSDSALVPEDILAGFYFSQDSFGRARFQIIESGSTKSSPTNFALTDTFRITQSETGVRYYRNGVRLRASAEAAVTEGDIRIGCALYASGDQFPATTEAPAPPDVWTDFRASIDWLDWVTSDPVTLPFTYNDTLDGSAGIYGDVTQPEGFVIKKIRVTGTIDTSAAPADSFVEFYFGDQLIEVPVTGGLQTITLPAFDVSSQWDPENPTNPIEFDFDFYSSNSGLANVIFNITQFDVVLDDAPPAPGWVPIQESSLAYEFVKGSAVSLVNSHALCDPGVAPDPFGASVSHWGIFVDAPGALLRITPMSYSITNPWDSGTGPGAVYHAGSLRGDSSEAGDTNTYFENEAAPWPSTNFDGTNDVVGWSPTDPVVLYVTSDSGAYMVGYNPGYGSDARLFWEHFDFLIEVWDTPSAGGGDSPGACFWNNLIGVEQDCI
jgi:hypothetical protein